MRWQVLTFMVFIGHTQVIQAARAPKRSAIIFRLQSLSGNATTGLAERIGQILQQELRASGSRAGIAKKSFTQVAYCAEDADPCLGAVLKRVHTTDLFFGSVRKLRGKRSVVLRLTRYSRKTGRIRISRQLYGGTWRAASAARDAIVTWLYEAAVTTKRIRVATTQGAQIEKSDQTSLWPIAVGGATVAAIGSVFLLASVSENAKLSSMRNQSVEDQLRIDNRKQRVSRFRGAGWSLFLSGAALGVFGGLRMMFSNDDATLAFGMIPLHNGIAATVSAALPP